MEDAARFSAYAKSQPDWVSHRPGVELVVYLALLDYEVKALVYQLLTDQSNRVVWEKYLALQLSEGLDNVPRMIAQTIRGMQEPGTASKADLQSYLEANTSLKAALRQIRSDTAFMATLKLIRNSVAAHPNGPGPDPLEATTEWIASSRRSREAKLGPEKSQIVEYAVSFARSIQDFAAKIAS